MEKIFFDKNFICFEDKYKPKYLACCKNQHIICCDTLSNFNKYLTTCIYCDNRNHDLHGINRSDSHKECLKDYSQYPFEYLRLYCQCGQLTVWKVVITG